MKLTLKWNGDSGDGKRSFVVAEENDGWKDLRIEVDTDDCDSEYAKKTMQEVINRCNKTNDVNEKWECFCDESYFGLWAVRLVGENRWGYCFHVQSKKESEGLCDLLNNFQKKSDRTP
jgi:hypothetical protein